jgi:hypothetical protein
MSTGMSTIHQYQLGITDMEILLLDEGVGNLINGKLEKIEREIEPQILQACREQGLIT